MADSTNGAGPWYCRQHYAQLKGWPYKSAGESDSSYRARWFVGKLHYQPPRLGDYPPWRCVGRSLSAPASTRTREPGEDEDFVRTN
jgi:hypothetical protein